MAKEFSMSPLLRARPDFLGVAQGGDNLNIFKELHFISKLFTILDSLNLNLNQSDNGDSDISEDPTLEEPSLCNGIDSRGLTLQNKEELTAGTSQGDKNIANADTEYQVFDRSADETSLIPYHCNDGTLKLFNILKKLKIPFETELYKPKEKRSFVDSNVYYCKNLFLKDRKGQYFLVICHEDLNMDLKLLRKTLNAYRNFNFGTADDMSLMLGTLPGGVSPFGLMNPNAAGIKMVVHKSLVKEDAWLMFHPLDHTLATKITLPSLLRFIQTCNLNHDVTFIK
ncbi:aminoacyl-tRNA editing [Mactra antiquata]